MRYGNVEIKKQTQISDDIKQFSYEICQKHKVIIRYMETDKDHIWKKYPDYLRKHFWKEHTFWTERWRQWVLKAYKYRIYPNSEQRIQIAKTFGCCRFVYNQTLAYRKEIYEKEKKSVSKTDCNNYCNRELKKDYEWLKEIDKFALTNAIYNMDAAYQKFFKEHAGYPKFKSKHDNHKSYTTNFTNGNIAAD